MALARVLSRALLALMALLSMVEAQRPNPFVAEKEQTPLSITPTILVGLLIGGVWLAIFLSGFCCLFSVQTPAGFVEKPLVLNKTY
mmetsp:Transcript_15974/g.37659  ORF Transcript_15974/g.37659 Transcript_15974/m.37659 type:complete len:86 (+) Transcript_15974:91-348(+)